MEETRRVGGWVRWQRAAAVLAWLLCGPLLSALSVPALAQPAGGVTSPGKGASAGARAGTLDPRLIPAVPGVHSADRPVVAGETILVGLMDRFPPFHSWNAAGDRAEGFDLDLLAEIGRTTGLRFEVRRYPTFSQLLDALAAGQVRVITATAQTAERATYLRFTRPYASVQQAFVGPAGITSVPSTPDLSGRRLAVTKGHVSETIAIERFAAASRPAFATVDLAIDAVQRGDADFVLEALPTLKALLAQRQITGLSVLRTYGFPEGHLRFASALNDAALVQQIDGALRTLDPAVTRSLGARWLPPAEARPAMPATPPPAAGVTPLRVGFLPGDTPYSIIGADGKPDGIGIRMLKAVSERAGVPIAGFQPMSLADGLAALRDGRLDVMLGLTDIASRRSAMTFVGPYRANPLVIISRKQYSVWDLYQLSGQRLAMVEGFFGTPYVRAAQPTIEIVDCKTFEECMILVEQGKANAALYGLQGAYERLGSRAGTTLQITGTVPGLYDEHNLGVSLARASLAPRLRDALNVVLSTEMAGIEAAWLAEEARSRVDWRRVRLAALASLAVLLALALGWWWHSRGLQREIARTDAAKDESEQYLAFMAHEVRNALQSVSGAVALLRGSSKPDSRQVPLLEALGRSTRSTLGLLNGLLDRHRLHAGRLALELRADSLERVLRAVIDETLPAAQAKGLTIAFERATPLDGWWRIDALRLQQIVRNLLVNAVKFTTQGCIVLRASLEASPRGAAWRSVRVEVVDPGLGMDAATVTKTFERFHTQGGDRPGTGLGLNLCRDLARALGGDLTVQSSIGQGSTFTLRFEAEAADSVEGAEGRLQRLLVVEDSPVYSLLLRQAFENQGLTVTVAESLDAAREALIASVAGAGNTAPPFDLVLSDTHLGDGRVDELLRFTREAVRPGVVMPPILCMSAEFDDTTLERLHEAGATDLMTKDSDVIAFASRVLTAYAQARGPAPMATAAP
jgi:two-component system, NarL family, sensor histidine kinase EvgS